MAEPAALPAWQPAGFDDDGLTAVRSPSVRGAVLVLRVTRAPRVVRGLLDHPGARD